MSLTAGNLFISSYNNQDFETSTNFTINLSVPVTKAKRLRLLGATLPNLMFPFGNNDKLFQISINGTPYTITFSTSMRWADTTAFCSYMTSLFSAGGSPLNRLTVTYSSSTNLLTITSSTNTDALIVPAWNWNASTTSPNIAQCANYRLGFTNSVNLTGTGAVTAIGFPNVFQRTNTIFVVTNVSTDSNNDANIGNILGRIPVNIGWGGVIQYENVHSDFASPLFCENIKEIRVQLLDEDYQMLTNPDNAYFNLVIGIEY